jgi:hypothetical protein
LEDGIIEEAIAETLIEPLRDFRLFEYFCIIRFLQDIDDVFGVVEFQPIGSESSEFALFEGESIQLKVYHDQTGQLEFREPISSIGAPTIQPYRRFHKSSLEFSSHLTTISGNVHTPTLYEGRPDLVVEMYDTRSDPDSLIAVLLGEFKYSSSRGQFRRGLEELVHYCNFAKIGNRYLSDNDAIPIQGLLVMNGVGTSGSSGNIIQLNASDILSINWIRNGRLGNFIEQTLSTDVDYSRI